MGFNSGLEGEQILAALQRIMNVRTGRVTVAATAEGHAHYQCYDATGTLNIPRKAFASVKRYDYGAGGNINANIGYEPQVDFLVIHLYGDGVKAGESYEVEYLLIE